MGEKMLQEVGMFATLSKVLKMVILNFLSSVWELISPYVANSSSRFHNPQKSNSKAHNSNPDSMTRNPQPTPHSSQPVIRTPRYAAFIRMTAAPIVHPTTETTK